MVTKHDYIFDTRTLENGKLIYRSGKECSNVYKKIEIRVGGECEPYGEGYYIPIIKYDINVDGSLIQRLGPEKIRYIPIKREDEINWVALFSALREFVNRATSRWVDEWPEGAGSYGWNLTIQSSDEEFLEEVAEEMLGRSWKDFDGEIFGPYSGKKEVTAYLLLFSQVKLQLIPRKQ